MRTQHVINAQEHAQWFEKSINDELRRILIVQDAGSPIGFVQFDLQSQCTEAEWGFYLAPNAPKGGGYILGVTALNYAFNEMGIQNVCGKVLSSNSSSVKFHKKLGFILSGQENDAVKEQILEMLIYRITKQSWIIKCQDFSG
jgi:UDP-4-amino-4,6-dideoxy-N-acetyl-beta-L-altrosamine N-acetyltransferase